MVIFQIWKISVAQSPTPAPVEWQGGDDEDLSYLGGSSARRLEGVFFKQLIICLEKSQGFKWITGYYMED